MAVIAAWARVVFRSWAGVEFGWTMGGPGRPDLAVVDALARTHLAARALGGRLAVTEASADVAALLDLCGLRPLLGQVGGQPEGGEQVGVEEGVEPGDPVA